MAIATFMGKVYQYEIEGLVETNEGITASDTPDFWGVYRRPIAPDEDGNHLVTWMKDYDTFKKAMYYAHEQSMMDS